jgi:hypothetical protein
MDTLRREDISEGPVPISLEKAPMPVTPAAGVVERPVVISLSEKTLEGH